MSILQFKKVNCKNCYKCVRFCPVKAIEVREHQARIIENECILCGNCTVVCPQNAKEDLSDLPGILSLLAQGRETYVSLAPSWAAQYPDASLATMRRALAALGFAGVEETAEGAYLVKSAYESLVASGKYDTLISSCCPAVVQYIERHVPAALPHLAPVLSPMQAHARLIKERHPGAAVVFIGPCIAKKSEARSGGAQTDFVLTFDELDAWLLEADISIAPRADAGETSRLSRLFPVSGGILGTMAQDDQTRYLSVDGMERCIDALGEVVSGRLKGCFIEMSACRGSCIGGPSFRRKAAALLSRRISVERTARAPGASPDYDTPAPFRLTRTFRNERVGHEAPTPAQIGDILRRMGKSGPEDELNCGTCGYATCREKAAAVFCGKAEISMCLPFMKERAESLSNKILDATPNAIVTVDTDLKIQQLNRAACALFGIAQPHDVIGGPVSRIMDEFDFVSLIASGEKSLVRRVYRAEYAVYLEEIFLHDRQANDIICIMKDITGDRRRQKALHEKKQAAAGMADEIVARQLRIVHEIASLLGETAAETKIAVEDLKQTILMDEEDA